MLKVTIVLFCDIKLFIYLSINNNQCILEICILQAAERFGDLWLQKCIKWSRSLFWLVIFGRKHIQTFQSWEGYWNISRMSAKYCSITKDKQKILIFSTSRSAVLPPSFLQTFTSSLTLNSTVLNSETCQHCPDLLPTHHIKKSHYLFHYTSTFN